MAADAETVKSSLVYAVISPEETFYVYQKDDSASQNAPQEITECSTSENVSTSDLQSSSGDNLSTISKIDAEIVVSDVVAEISNQEDTWVSNPEPGRGSWVTTLADDQNRSQGKKSDLTVLAIGDPHFEVSNIKESKEMSDEIIALVKERKPDLIVCLGDILDRHETIHVAPLTHSIKFLYRLEQLAPLYVVIGNHDRPNNSDFLSDQHPFNAVKVWKNTTIVDKVVDTNIKGHRFIFVPYVPPGRFEEALSTINNPIDGTAAFFAHQEFFGAQMGAIVSREGDKWPHINPLVISGHIHDYGRPQPNIIYTGTPMQHAFGDREDKTVSWFTFYGDKELVDESTSEPYHEPTDDLWDEERIELKLTKRTIVYLKSDQVMAWQPPQGKLVKTVIRGTSSEIKATMKLQYVKELVKLGVKVVYKTIEAGSEEIKDLSLIMPQVPYLQKLGQVVDTDPGQKAWFEKLFGGIDTSATSSTSQSPILKLTQGVNTLQLSPSQPQLQSLQVQNSTDLVSQTGGLKLVIN